MALGFTHATTPAHDRRREGHWFFEVYPHPAQVMLFRLSQIIKYKKGTLAVRRTGLKQLRSRISHDLVQATPALQMTDQLDQLLNRDLETLIGKELKQYEDSLDALVCAYLAMWYWTWGNEKTEMIGNLQEGYIINPTTHA